MNAHQTNVATWERIVRVVGGAALAAVSAFLLAGGASVWAAAVEIALIAAGLDFVYTGMTGYCPLYHKLGGTAARRRSSPRG